jgi:ubiquinone/menaquinone biosynthesis C-methylase UbiE
MAKVEEIDSFYSSHYREIMGTGLISKVWAAIHKQMEKPFKGGSFPNILEIGAGNGEHIPFVSCDYEKYFATDIRIDNLANIAKSDPRIRVEIQDAHQLNLPSDSFDRIIVTCLLAHLERPEEAITELRRLVKKGNGFVTIYLPCEPGLFLRLVRYFSTHWKARRRGVSEISRLHYLEHRNYFLALDNLVKHEFRGAKIKSRFYPFFLLTWNSNLYRIYQISNVL